MTTVQEARSYAAVLYDIGRTESAAAMRDLANQVERLEAQRKELREALQAVHFYIIGESLPTKEQALGMINAAIRKATQ